MPSLSKVHLLERFFAEHMPAGSSTPNRSGSVRASKCRAKSRPTIPSHCGGSVMIAADAERHALSGTAGESSLDQPYQAEKVAARVKSQELSAGRAEFS